jgi:hypothetical protein
VPLLLWFAVIVVTLVIFRSLFSDPLDQAYGSENHQCNNEACLEWFSIYAELCGSMQNCTRHKKDKPGPSCIWGFVLEWFYAEPCKVQKDKPGPSSFGSV